MATDINELTAKYIKLRDRKAALVKAHKAEVARYDEALDQAESVLLALFAIHGLQSVGTESGTAYKTTRTSATVADWDPFLKFVQEGEHWQMLERRVAKLAVEEFAQASGGDMPPGVNYTSEITINVRRS